MLAEIIDALAPAAVQRRFLQLGKVRLRSSSTHVRRRRTHAAILDCIPRSRVIAIDADPEAYARARALRDAYPGRLTPVHANFSRLADALESSPCAT